MLTRGRLCSGMEIWSMELPFLRISTYAIDSANGQASIWSHLEKVPGEPKVVLSDHSQMYLGILH